MAKIVRTYYSDTLHYTLSDLAKHWPDAEEFEPYDEEDCLEREVSAFLGESHETHPFWGIKHDFEKGTGTWHVATHWDEERPDFCRGLKAYKKLMTDISSILEEFKGDLGPEDMALIAREGASPTAVGYLLIYCCGHGDDTYYDYHNSYVDYILEALEALYNATGIIEEGGEIR